MKRYDTAFFKFKACAIMVFLSGLFALFAAGCTKTADDNTQQQKNTDLSNFETVSNTDLHEPSETDFDLTVRDITGFDITIDEITNPDATKGDITRLDITKEQISLFEITTPDNGITTAEPPITVPQIEKTEQDNPLSRETIAPIEGEFVIGEDTTSTMVYGFNG